MSYEKLFTQLSLFLSPLSNDKRAHSISLLPFPELSFTRIEATDGSVGVVADIQDLLDPKGNHLRLLEANFEPFDIQMLFLTRNGSTWHCDKIKSLDSLRIVLPTGHRLDSRQLNRVLRFFADYGVDSVTMRVPPDPMKTVFLIPEVTREIYQTGILQLTGLVAPIIDSDELSQEDTTPTPYALV